MKNGDKIRVLQMEDHNGMDTQAIRMNGKTYTVDYLDDAGQIHLQESGLAVIPDVDRYVVIERGKEYSSIQEYDREILAIYDVITDYIRINEYVEEGDGLFSRQKESSVSDAATGNSTRSGGYFLPNGNDDPRDCRRAIPRC